MSIVDRRSLPWVAIGVLAIAGVCSLHAMAPVGSAPRRAAEPRHTEASPKVVPRKAFASSPPVGRVDPRYYVQPVSGGLLQARNVAQHFTSQFDSHGVSLLVDSGEAFSLRTAALRCGGKELPLSGSNPNTGPVSPQRVTRALRSQDVVLEEWFQNGPLGLEQGWTFDVNPCASDDALSVEVDVTGLSVAQAGNAAIALRDATGYTRARYGNALAVDAVAREHAVTLLALHDTRISIRVSTADVVWPLTVDPLTTIQEAVLTAQKGTAGAQFGSAVGLGADTLIVGAPFDDVGPSGMSGSARVFVQRQGQWSEQQVWVAPDDEHRALFGSAVDLSGDIAIVGAPFACAKYEFSPGHAYVFTRNEQTWSPTQKLSAMRPDDCDHFGQAISIYENTALIGVGGAAIVFDRIADKWEQTAELSPHSDTELYYFGSSVSLHGDTAFVGGQGEVYVFLRAGSAWTVQQVLQAPEPDAGFGGAVAVHGDVALIGAPLSGVAGFLRQGAVYVYQRSESVWSQTAKLVSGDGAADTLFGSALRLNDGAAFVGAPGDLGAVYRFARSGSAWSSPQRFAGESAPGARFGAAFAIGPQSMVVGSPDAMVGPNDREGSVNVFAIDAPQGSSARLTAAESPFGNDFGMTVAVDGETAIAGAPDANATDSRGSAYLFTRRNNVWPLQQQLTALDTKNFAAQVALSGGTALIGDGAGTAQIFVHDNNSWSWRQTLTKEPGTGYGHAIAIDGETACIASDNTVEVYKRKAGVWQSEQLLSVDGTTAFGSAIAVSGDTMLIGESISWPGFTSHSAHIFARRDGHWSKQVTLAAPEAASIVANEVALSGDTAIVAGRTDQGDAALVFVRNGDEWKFKATLLTGVDSLALEGDSLVVADYNSVLLWLRQGGEWSRAAQLHHVDDPGSVLAVALSKSSVVIGTSTGDGEATVGSAVVYHVPGLAGQSCNEGCADWQDSAGQLHRYSCVDDVCCTSQCADPCGACSVKAGGSAEGRCTPISASLAHVCNGGYLCNGLEVTCPSACRADDQCAKGWFCSEIGSCVPQLPKGSSCDPPSHCADPAGCQPCQSGFSCVEGVCCDSACDGPCDTCRAQDEKSEDGTCVTKLSGSPGSPACAGNLLCNGVDATCPSACSSHADCEATHFCADDLSCVLKRKRGESCSEEEACRPGLHCADGVCCNELCDNSCEACNEPDSKGTCRGIDGTPRNNHPGCGGESDCAGHCEADHRDGCVFPDHTQTCDSSYCKDGLSVVPVCNGQGDCVPGMESVCEGLYTCKADKTGCASSCDHNAECVAGAECNVEEHQCVYIDATCTDAFTVGRPNGVHHDCKPYRCRGGACRSNCDKDSDCDQEHDCREGQCVPADAAKDSSGCACIAPGNTAQGPALTSVVLLFSVGLLARLARRRRH